MAQNNKTYGFTIVVKELKETVPNLFRYASAYKRANNITSQGLWEMFADDHTKKDEPKSDLPEDILKMETKLPDVDPDSMEGEVYNMCHFWSNFEIARLDFFRSKAYQDFFEMLDRSGGFWSERVCFRPHILQKFSADSLSGEMPLFTLSPPVCSLVLPTFTTSVISDTDTPPSSTAPPTPPPGNSNVLNGWNPSSPMTQPRPRRRMTTSSIGTPNRRTALGVVADAIRTSRISRASAGAACQNGSRLRVAGLRRHKGMKNINERNDYAAFSFTCGLRDGAILGNAVGSARGSAGAGNGISFETHLEFALFFSVGVFLYYPSLIFLPDWRSHPSPLPQGYISFTP